MQCLETTPFHDKICRTYSCLGCFWGNNCKQYVQKCIDDKDTEEGYVCQNTGCPNDTMLCDPPLMCHEAYHTERGFQCVPPCSKPKCRYVNKPNKKLC